MYVCGWNMGKENLHYVIREVFLQKSFEFCFNFVFFFIGKNSESQINEANWEVMMWGVPVVFA